MARYYPHSAPGSKNYKPDPVQDLDKNGWADWLYGAANEGTWTKEDQDRFDTLYAFEPFKTYFDYLLDKNIREKIFDLTGTDYSDIHDPRNVVGTGNAGRLAKWGLNFVSDNVKRLYR